MNTSTAKLVQARSILFCGVACIASCSGERGERTPEAGAQAAPRADVVAGAYGMPPSSLQVLPGDLFSALGETPIEVAFFQLSRSTLPDEISKAIRLVGPDDKVVSVTTQYFDASADLRRGHMTSYHHLRVIPITPLAPGWHTLTFDSLPSDLTVQGDFVVAADGSGPMWRLRVDSLPFVNRIDVCKKEDDRYSVQVGFSEPVPTTQGFHVKLIPVDGGAPCELGPPDMTNAEPEDTSKGPPSVERVGGPCTSPMTEFSLSWPPGTPLLAGPFGTSTSSGVYVIEVKMGVEPTLPNGQKGCAVWHP